jgi:hypothetical protein
MPGAPFVYLDVLPRTLLAVVLAPVIARSERSVRFHPIAGAVKLLALDRAVFRDRVTRFVLCCHSWTSLFVVRYLGPVPKV